MSVDATRGTRRPVIPDVTLVIPTLARAVLTECAAAIGGGTCRPAAVVLVNQGRPRDAEPALRVLREAGIDVRHITSSARGAAAGRNLGFASVTTPFIAATDDDCIVAPDWLERMADRVRTRPYALVTGRVEEAEGPGGTVVDVAAPSLTSDREEQRFERPRFRRDPLFSNNMGFAAELLRRIGPMDEDATVRYAEDAEWSYRALRAGVHIVFAPEVRVGHMAWRGAEEVRTVYRRYARSQGAFYGRYLRRGDAFICARTAFELARMPWLLLRGLATGNGELVTISRAYAGQLLPGLVEGWRSARPHA